MLILALDSTALVGSVALCDNQKLISEITVNTGHTHSETLLPMVESLLSICGYTVDDIDLFACTTGPGSFTGVRIGVATIKGLAYGRGKPCVGVSTLDALAYNAIMCNGLLCPVMNARRMQVYNATFTCQDGVMTRLCPDRALAISELGEEIIHTDVPVYLTGDGADLVYHALTQNNPAWADKLVLLPERIKHQSGYSVAQIAWRMALEGQTTTDAALSPIYLRPSQAERERLAKEAANGGQTSN